MKVTVDIENSKVDQFLSYLEQNNIPWSNDTDDILDEDLSEAHIQILSKRINAAEKDPSRLSPIEDFYNRVDQTL